MITNERQYKITRADAEKFRLALAKLRTAKASRPGVHPRLLQAEREALESQLNDLLSELAEYEQLKAGRRPVISVDSFDELAEGLIKARIAAGLSQRALAERLGLKEQQIQRYEAEHYASASFQRLQQIAQALGVRIQKDILLPVEPTNFEELVAKLQQVALDRNFLVSHLMSSEDASRAAGEIENDNDAALTDKVAADLSRVFGWSRENILGAQPLSPPRFAAAAARFKMPAARSQQSTTIYAAYANYLATTVLKACLDLPKGHIPTEAPAFRRAIIDRYGSVTLLSALQFAWDLGVPVLPLRDPGTFHSACWRYEGRNVIVLKQVSNSAARWLFDLVHEFFHAAQNPGADMLEVIETDETSFERRTSDEEIAASQFAGDVLLDCRAEEIAQACVRAANGSVERLKKVIPRVADEQRVEVGALANYMAFRLSRQNINWWGAATNLQKPDADPWLTARNVFFDRFIFTFENNLDRQLLERALS